MKIQVEKLAGTAFQKNIWGELLKVPKGTTITYKELAERAGYPRAIRAVANAVGANPLVPHIPCHRVVRSDGSLGGYSGRGGTKAKLALLRSEGIFI